MSSNAQWRVTGTDQNGSYASLYLLSPDLANVGEAKKRARLKAMERWAKAGLKVRVSEVMCVG